jgi:hypothetical protein
MKTIADTSVHFVEMQEGRRLQNDCRAQQAHSLHEQPAQTRDHSIRMAEIGCPLAASIQNQELVAERHGFGEHAMEPAGLCQPDHDHDQVKKKKEEVTHPGDDSRTGKVPDFASLQ